MTDCNELMAKLNAIEAKLNSLGDKYIPKDEKAEIIDSGAKKGKALATAAILPLLGAFMTKPEAIAKFNRAYNKAVDAEYLASAAQREISGLRALAKQAKAEATGAKVLARIANNKIERVSGAVNTLSSKIDNVITALNKKIAYALGKALDAIGISSKARAVAGDALSLAFKALGKIFLILDILSTIFSIINAIDLRNRMRRLERQVSTLEKEVSRILGLLFSLKSRIKANERLAQSAKSIASSAESLAIQARTTANQARSVANGAAVQAAIAITQIAVVSGIAIGARGLASKANGTAEQALSRARVPGPRGLPGIAGRNGINGTNGLPGIKGINGKNGINGLPGRNGLNGINGKNGLPGKPITTVLNRTTVVNNNIMNPQDLALLRKIDATTTRTKATQNTHLGISTATNGVVIQSRAYLTTMQSFAAKAWETTRMDKVLNALTVVAVIHNAAMLSKYTGQTLLDAFGGALDLFGIDDEEGNRLDLNSMLGRSVENLLKTVLGEDVYNDTSALWKRANRIVSVGSNIAWGVRTIMDSSLDLSEYIANNTGKIGNALKRFGVVGEGAYPTMSTGVKAGDKWRRKIDRYSAGLETVDNAAETIEYVSSVPLEITEELAQIELGRQELSTLIVDSPDKDYPDNAAIKDFDDESKLISIGATPVIDDSLRGEQ